jgi:precorrin-6A/cobalt-precorrin-6A reductase
MILLLGGTSETSALAEGIAGAGFDVLVSTATDIELDVGCHVRISRRSGQLDESLMIELVESRGIKAIVDATHPYAAGASETALQVSRARNIPLFVFLRPASIERDGRIHFARDHEEAARIACSFGKSVLLTIGTRNLTPYAREGKRTGCRIVARVLPTAESETACREAGLDTGSIISEQGPFTLDENRGVIRRHGAGVIVTKDGGEAGGAPEKVEAARLEGAEVVVVERPSINYENCFGNIASLVEEIARRG